MGNRVLLTQGSTNTTYTVDKADRLTAVNSTPYTTDADGNLTQAGTDQARYDAANRLIWIFDGTTTTTYVYDGDGLRTSKTSGGATTNDTWDLNRSTPVVLADSTFKYVYGLGLVYAVTNGGSLGVYHTDGLGSVRAITDANGNLVEAYLTDAFGVSLGTEGTVTQPFGFTGQQQDTESGLYYLRARYYSPTLGRFISRDPTFGSITNPLSLNRFGYALDNPGLLVDPSGLSANRVTRNGADDNQCFSNAGGALAGNVINAACLNTPMGAQGVITVVGIPPNQHVVETVVFAKPGKGGGGGKGTGAGSSREEARAAGWTAEKIIGSFRRGGILREFPSQYLGSTVSEIEQEASQGKQVARKALKLLFDQRFMK